MIRPARRRPLVALAVGALAVTVLAGCSPWLFPSPDAASTVEPTSTPTGETVDPSLEGYYSQSLTWDDCGQGFVCSTATAPLDWSNPDDGQTIDLALVRHPASGSKVGSLLVNPGGPGASAFDFVRQSVDFAAHPDLQQEYDIVGVDPRGVGRSSAISCLDDKQADAFFFDILPGQRGSQEWQDALRQSSKTFADACAANTGPLLEFIDTESSARDMDMIRALLGDDKLNYLGYSYGTSLGAHYAGLFPDKVGRMVLDGAENPESTSFDLTLTQAQGFESALKAYLESCTKESDCWFQGSADDGLKEVQGLLAQVDKKPIPNEDGRQLGSSSLLTAIMDPLYSESLWSDLDYMFESVKEGEAGAAFTLVDDYYSRSSDGTYYDNLIQNFNAITCADYPVTTDPAVIAQQNEQLIAASPTVGPYWTYGDIGCSVWPYPSRAVPGPITAAGSQPILVVGTTNDPATPYVWAQALASQLENGHLITYQGEGHTAYNTSSCVDDVVSAYFLDGTVPSSDPQCTS
ncbi:proteinase [Cnuibacter physcomitrellae]|uniref:Peptidase n=1 Tax=Cnuibacter physcomitrellae TaxID=1619308 RepID=A0A1X9LLH9_9MICO|nr:alpha/beta hydrolase [Cnuibacter physcomitrellae]ARJ06066.1 peptidase [Cnuibacter physcomitrellae]GGI37140.1 proteinase [Cnuibacter physcomitrellae]